MKLWPFKVVKDPKSDRPQGVLTYQKKIFFAEEISSMVFKNLGNQQQTFYVKN